MPGGSDDWGRMNGRACKYAPGKSKTNGMGFLTACKDGLMPMRPEGATRR